jgi:uncharacterized protein (DUF1501 family)
MNRREFMQFAALMPLAGVLSEAEAAAAAINHAVNPNQRIVVLVQLDGGNDGLNTLVPYTDPVYQDKKMRSTLALNKSQIIDIGNGMGMHFSLKALESYWNDGQLAWIQGVGYPHPDHSHFRSIDIWETAASSNEYLNAGWLSQVLPKEKKGLHGIVLGDGLGPLAGKTSRAVAMDKPETFLQQAKLIKEIRHVSSNDSLAHILDVQNQLYGAKNMMERSKRVRHMHQFFRRHPFQNDLKSVAQMIVGGVGASVYKVKLGGFDTHAAQAQVHKNQLKYLADGLAAFAKAMKANRQWDNVLVVTYSEFGRRVKQNRSGGTDHGTAGPMLVMGGKVKGGTLYGDKPNLKYLDNFDLHHTIDFRQVYGSIANQWWGRPNPWAKHKEIDFIA